MTTTAPAPRTAARRATLRIAVAAVLLASTWLLWSGHWTPLLLTLGAASCGLALLVALRTGFFDPDAYTLDLAPRLLRYWLWLLGEIVRSNLAVTRVVLSRTREIAPEVVRIDAKHLPPRIQALLANAITLTPGTVTLDVNEGVIEVHCLTREIAAELEAGAMLRRAEQLIGD
jgi:multicomponent Na+:H+ antiporter subunit E